MPIKIHIQTSGVNTLEQAVRAFDKLGTSTDGASKSLDDLTATEQKLVKYLQHMGQALNKSAGQLVNDFKNLKAEMQQMSAQAEKFAGTMIMSRPFSQLATSARQVVKDLALMKAELAGVSALNVDKVNTAGYVDMVTDGKAAIQVMHMLDVEIEKQARLKSQLFAMDAGRAPAEWKAEIQALQRAQAETRKLIQERELLRKQMMSPVSAVPDTGLNNLIPSGIDPGFRLDKTLRAAYGSATNLSTAVRGTSLEIQKMISEEKGAESATVALYKANARLARSYNEIQLGAKSAGGSVLSALGNTGAAREQAERLAAANFMKLSAGYGQAAEGSAKLTGEVGKTTHSLMGMLQGTKQAESGLSGLGNKLNTVGKGLRGNDKAAIDWGKNMKFAIGGVARSMGAMTYSYSMLAPLLAGIAVGGAVKQVYALGAAFEYTTTYVDSLVGSLSNVSVGQLQEQLLNIEGLRKGPNELAMGMKEFAKAGVDAATSLGQIGEMSKFATIAELDMAEAAKLVIGQSQAFDQSFSDSANMIGAAALSSATSIEEMGTALSYTTELATVSKVSFDEVATAMAILANAGIRGCYDRETDVLTRDGWKRWEDVSQDDEFATYNADTGEIEFQYADRLIRYHHTGKMYKVANKGVDLCVTPDHRMYVKKRGRDNYEILTAEEIAGDEVEYKAWDGKGAFIEASLTDPGEIPEIFEGWVDYDDEVFCAEVPNGLLIVRRNGRAVVSGNSKAGTAIRTTILKMQAPTDGLKQKLDAVGISWSAFTEQGQVKNLRTMFSELKKATDQLPDQQRIEILKELFGLRALKGGANILNSVGEEWDTLNQKIKESTEGVSFLTKTYDKLEDTTTAKLEKLGAVWQQQLIKAFDSDSIKGLLDNITSIAGSEQLLQMLQGTVGILNSFATALSALGVVVSKFPVDLLDVVLGSLAVLGGPITATVAIIALLEKQITTMEARVKAGNGSWLGNLIFGDEKAIEESKSLVALYYEMVGGLVEYVGKSAESVRGGLFEGLSEALKGMKAQKPSDFAFGVAVAEDDLERTKAEIVRAVSLGVNDGFVLGLKESLLQPEVMSELDYLNKTISEAMQDGGMSDSALLQLKERKLLLEDNIERTEELNRLRSLGANYTPAVGPYADAIRDLTTSIAEISFDQAAKEAKVVEDELKKINDEVLKARGKGLSIIEQDKLRSLIEARISLEKFKKVAEETEALKWDGMVAGLKASKLASDQVKGGFEELKQQALDFLGPLGQMTRRGKDFGMSFKSKEAKQYFIALVQGSRLFEKALEDAKKKIQGIKNDLQDMKFGFSEDLAQVRAKLLPENQRTDYIYKSQLAQISELEKAARVAGEAGTDGRERQVELLKQAYEIAKGLDTSHPEGGDYIARVKAQIALLEGLQKQLTAAKQEDLKAAQDDLSGIQKQKEEFDKFVEAVNGGYKGVSEVATGYGVIVDANTGLIRTWGETASSEMDRVIEKQTAINNLMQQYGNLGNVPFSKVAGVMGDTPAGMEDFVKEAERTRKVSEEVGRAVEQGIKPATVEYEKFGDAADAAREAVAAMQAQSKAEIEAEARPVAEEALRQTEIQAQAVIAATSAINTFQANAFQKAGELKDRIGQATEELKANRAQAEEIGNKSPQDFQAVTDKINAQAVQLGELISLYNALIAKMQEASRIKPPSVPTNTSGRATGGNVAANQTYWVGERGPELFTSSSAGFIIPNHMSTSKSEGVVNLNLTIGGSEPVQLQGSKVEIGKLQRLLSDKARFAA